MGTGERESCSVHFVRQRRMIPFNAFQKQKSESRSGIDLGIHAALRSLDREFEIYRTLISIS